LLGLKSRTWSGTDRRTGRGGGAVQIDAGDHTRGVSAGGVVRFVDGEARARQDGDRLPAILVEPSPLASTHWKLGSTVRCRLSKMVKARCAAQIAGSRWDFPRPPGTSRSPWPCSATRSRHDSRSSTAPRGRPWKLYPGRYRRGSCWCPRWRRTRKSSPK